MTCKNKHKSTTAIEKILLDCHHHVARLAWLIQEYPFLVKKVIRNKHWNFSRGRTLCHITHSLIQFCLFKFEVTADHLFYSYKFYLYQNVYIYIYIYMNIYTHIYTFCLNSWQDSLLHHSFTHLVLFIQIQSNS